MREGKGKGKKEGRKSEDEGKGGREKINFVDSLKSVPLLNFCTSQFPNAETKYLTSVI